MDAVAVRGATEASVSHILLPLHVLRPSPLSTHRPFTAPSPSRLSIHRPSRHPPCTALDASPYTALSPRSSAHVIDTANARHTSRSPFPPFDSRTKCALTSSSSSSDRRRLLPCSFPLSRVGGWGEKVLPLPFFSRSRFSPSPLYLKPKTHTVPTRTEIGFRLGRRETSLLSRNGPL